MSSVFIYLFLITSAIQYQLRHQRSKTASLSRKMSASISPICNVGKLIQSMFFPLLHMNHIVSCLQQHPQCGYIFFTSESIHLGLDVGNQTIINKSLPRISCPQRFNKHDPEVGLTKVDDHLQKFEEGLASIQVSHPSTYRNKCGQECDPARSTIYPCTV